MNPTLSKYFFYYPVTALRGEAVWKYLKHYEDMQWKTADAIADYQTTELQKLLEHACTTVPYYKQKLLDNNLHLNDISTLEQLKELPQTTKVDIVSHNSNMLSERQFRFTSNKTTGGSTGQAVTITKNATALARERAATWRAYRWAGVGIGDIQARFWGTPLTTKGKLFYQAVDYVSNRTRLSAFNINNESLKNYYQQLTRLQPAYLYGYVSMIADFARYIISNKLRPLPALRCVITTSEVLSDDARKIIEEAFQVKVFNEYGCGEVGSIAHECEHGNMHIMADNVIVETDTSNSPDGSSGQLIITDLHNYAMPLIRYQVGDFATLSDKPCTCGRGLPLVEKIHGRAYDVIRDIDGNSYHPEILMYIFEELKAKNSAIDQFQVVQTDLDKMTVSIIAGDGYQESTEAAITQRIKEKLNPAFDITFNYIATIPREKSGKLRVIKSTL